MARICKTTPRGPDGRPVRVRCLQTAQTYLKAFFGLREPPKGGYGRYMTVNGYSSCLFVEQQPSQGLLKAALSDAHVLSTRAQNGDPEAARALEILKAVIDNGLRSQEPVRMSA